MQIVALRVKKNFTILSTLILEEDTIYVEMSTHRQYGRAVDLHRIFLADRTHLGDVRADTYSAIMHTYTEKIENTVQG